jgi:hypothetical protein
VRLAGAIRPALWLGAAFNAAVALGLLFPRLAGIAQGPEGPVFQQWTLAYFVALFAVAYAWMARQAAIPRPLVAFAAIGKAGVFAIALACLLRGNIHRAVFAVAVVDLLFAVAFAAWLRATGAR